MLGLACRVVRIFVLVELEQEIVTRRLAPPFATQFLMSPIIDPMLDRYKDHIIIFFVYYRIWSFAKIKIKTIRCSHYDNVLRQSAVNNLYSRLLLKRHYTEPRYNWNTGDSPIFSWDRKQLTTDQFSRIIFIYPKTENN